MDARAQCVVRVGFLAAAATVLAHVRVSGRPGTLCLLRTAVGLPCPLCGGTTAVARLGSGDVLGALRASPLAVLGAPVVAALPLLRPRVVRIPVRLRVRVLVAVLAAAQMWQLVRFHAF